MTFHEHIGTIGLAVQSIAALATGLTIAFVYRYYRHRQRTEPDAQEALDWLFGPPDTPDDGDGLDLEIDRAAVGKLAVATLPFVLVGATIAATLYLPPIHPLFVLLGAFIIFNAVFLAWFVLPFYARTLPGWLRRRVVWLYAIFSQYSFRRSIWIVREQVGLDVFASSYDPAAGADYIRIDGETRHFRDSGNRMAYLANRPMGLALERFSVVLDPIDAEIGRLRAELLEASESMREFRVDGHGTIQTVAEHVEIPLACFGVDLEFARHVLGGSAKPRDGEDTKDFTAISQIPFQSGNAVDVLMYIVVPFLAVFFMIYLAFSVNAGGGSGGGGGGGIDVSIMLFPGGGVW